MIRPISWTAFKALCNSKGYSMQCVEETATYFLYVEDAGITFVTTLLKTSPANDDQADFETNFKPAANIKNPDPVQSAAFAKKVENGKKLFLRTHGVSFALSSGANICNFTIPYPVAKVTGIEVVGCEAGDSVNLYVLDTPTGTISGVPNLQLNQFGYSVFMPNGFYSRQSNYDADIYQNMVIKVTYNSISAKTIYVNYLLHELK
jgi:hypothetical protein